MVLELILCVGIASSLCCADMAIKAYFNSSKKTALQIAPYPSSDTAKLIIELLKADKGWAYKYKSGGFEEFSHPAGVKMLINDKYKESHAGVYSIKIAEEADRYESISLSAADCTLIRAELRAYQTREKAAREAELTRILAQRVVDGTSVLGGSGVPQLPSSSDDNCVRESEAVSSGLLTYDPKTERIVKIGGINSRTVDMHETMRKRYGLRTSTPDSPVIGTLYGSPITVKDLKDDKDLRAAYTRDLLRPIHQRIFK